RRRIQEAEERARLAAERERRSLARDLHDVVAHNLTIISMQARTAQYLGTPEAAQSVLAVVGDSAKDALVDLRRMLAILQEDGIVDPAGEPGAAG
ncbi:histidine kinase, partial [Micrococcus endophyticus]